MRINGLMSQMTAFGFLIVAPSAVGAMNGEQIQVPTDSRASYYALAVEDLGNGIVEITTKRVAPSGVSFSKRSIKCHRSEFKYLGDGDTYEEMIASKPKSNYAALVDGSISHYVSLYACSKVGG